MDGEWNHIKLGTRLSGKYEILEKVAVGGGGPVFSAIADEDFFQVHFFSKAQYPDKEALKIRVDKAGEVATICPEVILAPSDYGFYEEIPYVVYKIRDVKPLQGYLEPGNRFSGPDVQGFFEALFMMLDLVHESGFTHLGLSPLSIYVREGGVGPLNVIVLDWCLAPQEGQGFYADPAADKELLSIASYVSPEQASSSGGVDHRADLYAVGALVHRLVLGREPFEAATLEEIVDKVKGEAPAFLDEKNTDIFEGMRSFLTMALDKDPEKRFQDGSEMMGAFSKAVAEETQKEEAEPPREDEGKTVQEQEPEEEKKEEEIPDDKLSLSLPLSFGQKRKSVPQVSRDKLMSLFDRLQKEKQKKARPETGRKGPLDAKGLKELVAAGRKDKPSREKKKAPAAEEKPADKKAEPEKRAPDKAGVKAKKRHFAPPKPPPGRPLFAPRKPPPPKPGEVKPDKARDEDVEVEVEITRASVEEVISDLAPERTDRASSEPAMFMESLLEDRKKIGIITAVAASLIIIFGVVIIIAVTSKEDPTEEVEKLESLEPLGAMADPVEPEKVQAPETPEQQYEKPVQEQPAAEPAKTEPVKEDPVKGEPAKSEPVKEEPAKAEPMKKTLPPEKEGAASVEKTEKTKKPAPVKAKEEVKKKEKKPAMKDADKEEKPEKKKKKKKKKEVSQELEYL